MNNKILLTGLVGIAILGGVIFWSGSKKGEQNNLKSNNEPVSREAEPINQKTEPASQEAEISVNEIILFYGDGCPHCVNVEKFIEENKIGEKVAFKKLEVFSKSNKKNLDLMAEKYKLCGLSTESLGVPFLWDGDKCYSGEIEITDFFKQKASL